MATVTVLGVNGPLLEINIFYSVRQNLLMANVSHRTTSSEGLSNRTLIPIHNKTSQSAHVNPAHSSLETQSLHQFCVNMRNEVIYKDSDASDIPYDGD